MITDRTRHKPTLQRAFAVSGIVAALLALLLTAPAAAENQPFSSWFKYGSEVDAIWDVASTSLPYLNHEENGWFSAAAGAVSNRASRAATMPLTANAR